MLEFGNLHFQKYCIEFLSNKYLSIKVSSFLHWSFIPFYFWLFLHFHVVYIFSSEVLYSLHNVVWEHVYHECKKLFDMLYFVASEEFWKQYLGFMFFRFTQPQNEITMCMLKRLCLMLSLISSLSMVSKLFYLCKDCSYNEQSWCTLLVYSLLVYRDNSKELHS